MPPEIEPETPTEGGRVYKQLTVSELQNRASDTPSGYQVAEAIRAQVESNLTDAARGNLADAKIDAFGFEVEVGATAGGASPFGALDGAVGISLVWITGVDEGGDPGPFLALFADYGEDGVEPIADAPDPAGGVEGSFFAAHFGDDSVSLTRSEWDRAIGSVGVDAGGAGGLLSGETVLYGADDSVFVWDKRDVWHAFVSRLDVASDGLSVGITESRYLHDEWLLGQLGFLVPLPAQSWDPPEHPFWENGPDLVPLWALGDDDAQDPLDGVAGLSEYGNSELYYDVGGRTADVSQLQADLWELGFWFRGMVEPGQWNNYSFEPGNQSDLTTAHATGDFHVVTEWAVREFQIAAKRETVAHHTGAGNDRYVENLETVENDAPYEDEISGVLNEATAQRIQHWLDNDWRCPVVVEALSDADTVTNETHAAVNNGNAARYGNAFTDAGGNSRVVLQNIWQRLDPEEAANPQAARMFVSDFSGYYGGAATEVDVPAIDVGGLTLPAAYVVGDYIHDNRWTGGGAAWVNTHGGPRGIPASEQTWPDTGEVLPQSIVGAPVNLAPLTGASAPSDTLSTYKVVRASSELECYGYFDSVNSWDLAIASLGPCHWTLALRPGVNPDFNLPGWSNNRKRNAVKEPTQETYGPGGVASAHGDDDLREGELPAYFSYLQSTDANAFDEALGEFGVGTDGAWGHDGSDLFNAGGRKYSDKLSLHYRVAGGGGNVAREPVHRRDGDYFRNWHWFFRFVMACRTVDGFRERMWDMTRIRIRDIRNTLWPEGVAHLPDTGVGDPVTIGDVVTSERAIALVLRWHIKSPGHVTKTNAATTLGDAVDAAWSGWNQDLSTNDWSGATGDQHEADMVTDIVTQMNNDGIGRLDDVEHWPHWGGWQTNAGHPCHYRLFAAGGPGAAVNPAGNDLLDDDRDTFDFDDDVVGADSPDYVIQGADAWLRDPANGYAAVTGAAPLHVGWNGLAYVNHDPHNNTWEVDRGTPVEVTDRDTGPAGAVVEIEHANDGTRIGWTNMGNV